MTKPEQFKQPQTLPDGTPLVDVVSDDNATAELADAIAAHNANEEVIEARVVAEVEYRESQKELSEFQKLLAQTRSRAVLPLYLQNAPQEEWFVCCLSREDMQELGLQQGRLGIGQDNAKQNTRRIIAIVLYLGVVKGRSFSEQDVSLCDDTTRIFASPEEAELLFSEKGWSQVPDELFKAILSINPQLTPEKKELAA